MPHTSTNASPDANHTPDPASPADLGAAAMEYWRDAWQRVMLYADIRRQRGDQYRAHLQEDAPNVLNFPCELVMSGMDLPRPVNYGMVRILPSKDQPTDDTKRPFVVIDPRAGHGPGIGGFKPDSEIGAAMKAGHPCYFVGFLPDPVPGQTVEDVMRADAAFVQRAAELHPGSRGKPAVIGNCQAGWQVLMAASLWPDLFGPIIVAGSPLSYWAGTTPMRYAGGLMGGSWPAALTSDLGDGRFDGAWLVQNFENLNPANTLWDKQYNVYANVDTEGPRYLEFEKYWGGYVYLNDVEIQYIVDNLFIGNKLTSGELLTSDGMRIDLRNIRSPIVVFCSYGDNITPPPQALGWITDLYRTDADVVTYDQTIVYATHDSIGHLGIFVSSSVGRKEHHEFASNIDLIDLIPPGIYRAQVDDDPNPDASGDRYRMRIRASSVQDVRDIVQPDPESDRRFRAAARVSEINLALYRTFAQPWVKALSTPDSAEWLGSLQPLRLGFEQWSSNHPMAPLVAQAAEQVQAHRQPVSADNPFLQAQQAVASGITQWLDTWRDQRDKGYAALFDAIYGSPWMQALSGQTADDGTPARPHPGSTPEHRANVKRQAEQLQYDITHGGLLEAGIRALLYVLRQRGETDGRRFQLAMQLRRPDFAHNLDFSAVRTIVRHQALLLAHDSQAAMAALPMLLQNASAQDIQALSQTLDTLVNDGEPMTDAEALALREVQGLLARAGGSSPANTAVAATPRTRARKTTTAKTATAKAKPAA